jgi:uncharacterized protein YydD (DUF2326 family)
MPLVINSVSSNISTFRTVNFTDGFNIILADTTDSSEKKDSRNGLGKSTLIEIIHFCLGSKVTKGKGLACQDLDGWSFTLEITINGEKYTVVRSIEQGRSPTIAVSGNTSNWSIQPREKDGQTIMNIVDWTKVLGELIFGLIVNKENEEKKFQPSFRGLISYFIRRNRDAFSTPFESYRKQLEADKQISNTFLLGLGWEYAQKIQLLKDKDALLNSFKKLMRSSDRQTFFTVVGTLGELKTVKVRVEAQLRERQKELTNFRVHPQYRDLEESANRLTVEIHNLTNQSFTDQRLLNSYKLSIETELEPNINELVNLYSSIGIELQDLVLKKLDEVTKFHKKLVVNRKEFLSSEIERLETSLLNLSKTIKYNIEKRADILSVLNTHRALEEFTRLNELYLKDRADLNEIEKRIEELEKIDDDKSALIIEKANLLKEARRDHHERLHQTEYAIRLFNANSQFLYNAPGNLVINVNDNGFRFNVEIERDGSQGIGSMKVFCYDLILAQIWAEMNENPVALIHDSTIFDGVDERQIAKALQLAATLSKNYGFQYICTFNSDMIPYEKFDGDFNFNSFVRMRLTDDNDRGRLLGINF